MHRESHEARVHPRAAPHVTEDLARKLAKIRYAGAREAESDFVRLLALLRPRIARLVRQYGLSDMREDAEQAAAIGVHRALESFDCAQARFSTHVTWQIRGELQSLRHRMRLDQRRSAQSAGVSTVSLESLRLPGDAEARTLEIVDEQALQNCERLASDRMALGLLDRLLNRLDSPEDERGIVLDHILDRKATHCAGERRSSEQRRQIVRRTLRNCAKMAAGM
jgi:hypothetical protein